MSTGASESVLILPDTLVEWPWKRSINPHSLQVKAESSAWIDGFLVFTTRHVQQTFAIGDFGLLASLGYPLENKDIFRMGCDLMNFLFLLDLYSDTATPREAQQMAIIVMDAVRNPDKIRPAGECVVGEIARQFWNLSLKCTSSNVGASHRLIEELDKFTAAIAREAQDRAHGVIRNIDEYFPLRRDTIAVRPVLVILQFGLNLPNEVFEDPIIQRLVNVCVDLIILGNDMYSYDIEQARGDGGHNLITILMRHENLGLNEAIRWIADYCSKLTRNFLNDLKHVPSFGKEFEDDMNRYLNGLGNWVRAADCWSLESPTYFAAGGLEIQQNGKVILTSKSKVK